MNVPAVRGAVDPARVLMIVPTYKERENLPPLLDGVYAAVPQISVLVVDDDSPDGTGEAVEALKARHPRLDLLTRKGERGLGGAINAGYREGLARGFDVIGQMDADLSHDPAHLPAMIAALADADVVLGSRYVAGGRIENWGAHRYVLSWSANRFAALMVGVNAADMTTGYRLWRAAMLRAIDPGQVAATSYVHQVEMLARARQHSAVVGEVPITFRDRRAGVSKMAVGEITKGVGQLLRLRFRR